MEYDVMSCCPYSQWSKKKNSQAYNLVWAHFIASLILNIFFLSVLSLSVLWHRSLGNALHLLFTGALRSPRAAHTLTQSHTHPRTPIHRRWIIYLRVIWDQKYASVIKCAEGWEKCVMWLDEAGCGGDVTHRVNVMKCHKGKTAAGTPVWERIH